MTLFRTLFEDVEATAPPEKVLSVAVLEDVVFLDICAYDEGFEWASTRTLEEKPESDQGGPRSKRIAHITVDRAALEDALWTHRESDIRDRVRRTLRKKESENA